MPETTQTDVENDFPWAERTTTFDANGIRTSRRTVFDDGRISVITYDANGTKTRIDYTDPEDVKSWQSVTKSFDANGQLLTKTTVDDDGVIRTVFFDENGQKTRVELEDPNDVEGWHRLTRTFDENGDPLPAVRQKDSRDPITGPDTATTKLNESVSIDVLANDFDPDGDPLSIISVTNGAIGTATIDPTTGEIIYAYDASFDPRRSDTFTYTVSDGLGGTKTETVTVSFEREAASAFGYIIDGVQRTARFGEAVAIVSDVNGDGVDDILLGEEDAFFGTSGLFSDAGQSYLIFGGGFSGTPSRVTNQEAASANGVFLNGDKANEQSGFSVSEAGDINGDGIGDFLIGALGGRSDDGPSSENGFSIPGRTYVVFGQDTENGPSFPGTIDLGSLNGTNGFIIEGISADFVSGKFGQSISSAGDVNGDGIGDVVVGAPEFSNDPSTSRLSGEAYVIFGKNVAQDGAFDALVSVEDLDGTDGFAITTDVEVALAGRTVSSAGDLNGDGIDDLALTSIKGAYVIFGEETAQGETPRSEIDLDALNSADGFSFTGLGTRSSVKEAGDVNGDGIGDLLIADYSTSNDGRVHVVFGRDTATEGGFGATVDLDALDGSDGFSLGTTLANGFGASISGAGDLNGDGIDDILMGASHGRGHTFVVFGRDEDAGDVFSAFVDVWQLDGTDGYRLRGNELNSFSGDSISGGGDVTGDGVNDILISAIGEDVDGKNEAGAVYVVDGANLAAFDAADGTMDGVIQLALLDTGYVM